MALYVPKSILHLARSLYVRPETYGPTYVFDVQQSIHFCIINEASQLLQPDDDYDW